MPVDEHLHRVPSRVDGELRPLAGLQELLARVDVDAATSRQPSEFSRDQTVLERNGAGEGPVNHSLCGVPQVVRFVPRHAQLLHQAVLGEGALLKRVRRLAVRLPGEASHRVHLRRQRRFLHLHNRQMSPSGHVLACAVH